MNSDDTALCVWFVDEAIARAKQAQPEYRMLCPWCHERAVVYVPVRSVRNELAEPPLEDRPPRIISFCQACRRIIGDDGEGTIEEDAS